MATSLQNILSTIKTVALANGFITVEELKINMKSNADTELPRLIIKNTGISYNNLLKSSVIEEYKLELTIIIADSANPISDLKTLQDTLLDKLFNENILFNTLSLENAIELVDSNLTNERDIYAQLGGESVTLKINIKNANTFGANPCY